MLKILKHCIVQHWKNVESSRENLLDTHIIRHHDDEKGLIVRIKGNIQNGRLH